MTSSLPLRAALLSAVILGVAACHPKPPPPDVPSAPPDAQAAPAAPADAPEKADASGVTFGEGFHKEEAGPAATLRWARQDASLRIAAPADGVYQLTFRPFTVFSTVENTVEVSVNGQPAGSFSFRAFDVSNPVPTTLKVNLHLGDNTVRLRSKGAEHRMSDSDDRMVAYGLLVPLTVERAP